MHDHATPNVSKGLLCAVTQSARQGPQPCPPVMRLSLSKGPLSHVTVTSGLEKGHAPNSSSPCYVLFNSDREELDPTSLLSPVSEDVRAKGSATDKAATTATGLAAAKGTAVEDQSVSVFSFWHRPRVLRDSKAQGVAAPAHSAAGDNAANAATAAAAAVKGPPVVLHIPPVTGGWASQTDHEATERTALAGAAVACGDLLLLPLPLGALDGPASLLPQVQPLPILFLAMQQQMQLRMLQQQDLQRHHHQQAPSQLTEAVSRSKPLVLLLRDPISLPPVASSNRQAAALREATASTLRLHAAHAALRLLEKQWGMVAAELGAGDARDERHPQHLQQKLQEEEAAPARVSVPGLRELFSVHVVFVRRPNQPKTREASTSVSPDAILTECTEDVRQVLASLLAEHRAKDAEHAGQSELQQQKLQFAAADECTGGRTGGALHLFDTVATACRSLLAPPEATKLLLSTPSGSTQSGALKLQEPLSQTDAVAYDAEMFRRKFLARFKAEMAQVEGPREGFVVLHRVLRDFDASCASSVKRNLPRGQMTKAAEASVAEARQSLAEEAVKELRVLHRLQLEAVRSLAVRRFELQLQQLLNNRSGLQKQPENIYELTNRVSDAVRMAADSMQQFVQDYHQSLGPDAVRKLLLDDEGATHGWQGLGAAREILGAAKRVAAAERRRLLKALRELSASALQEKQLLLLHQQRQAGLGLLQRFQQNAVNRFLATRPGAVARRSWLRLSSTAAATGNYLRELPGLRLLCESPVANMWRHRKPIDISFHYLSPTAFGLSPVRVPPVLAATDLKKLKETMAMEPPERK
ncbi:hypothetical protein, conserved [Eimeria necatrix]|uniref:Uncharacterized protein n=1 Tax=Eimeria necatrix TaxID=51315 RepID=U6MXG4_9EIME|nr:hypothetical protein, conserved [Eimeria necatrix]CDJ66400.1 hypothetical protein, conserved [Eimeria necatrix]